MSKNKTGLAANFSMVNAVPGSITALFTVSVVLMNLLANKEINTGVSWLALDMGMTVSWLSFLVMDVVTKRYGPKTSVRLSGFAMLVNLLVCGMLAVAATIPGNWAEYYTYGTQEVNDALDATIGGTWYVLAGSTVAFMVSSVVNAMLNDLIGRKYLKSKVGYRAFAVQSGVSTLAAQFVDNLVFSTMVSYVFFGWTFTQVITCSVTGCVIELLCEMLFSPVGYKIAREIGDAK